MKKNKYDRSKRRVLRDQIVSALFASASSNTHCVVKVIQPDVLPITEPETIPQPGPSTLKPKTVAKDRPIVSFITSSSSLFIHARRNRKSKIYRTYARNMPKSSRPKGVIYCPSCPMFLLTKCSERRQAEIAQMEASIRKLNRKRGASESGSEDDEQRNKKKLKGKGASYLEAEMAKYTTRKVERDKDGKKKRKDESDILAALNSFKGQLKTPAPRSPIQTEGDDAEGESICLDYSAWVSQLHR